jgi:hypothetical protein
MVKAGRAALAGVQERGHALALDLRQIPRQSQISFHSPLSRGFCRHRRFELSLILLSASQRRSLACWIQGAVST